MSSRTWSHIALLPSIALIACSEKSPTDTDDRDTTRPVVASVTPTASATGVAIGSTLTVTFSEPVDPVTITAATFTVTGPGGPVAGTVSSAGAVATFTPTAPLTELAAGYTASVTTGVADTAGNTLAASHTWQFTTEMVSPLYWYRLSNQFLGDGKSLGTMNGATNVCFMADTGAGSGQYWQFTPLQPGRYRLTNAFRGPTLSLEGSNGSEACSLDPTGSFTGQFWTFVPVPGSVYYKLQTTFTGAARSLDVTPEEVPLMAETGTLSGQNWKVTRIGPIPPT